MTNEKNTTNVVSGASHQRSPRRVPAPMSARVGPLTPAVVLPPPDVTVDSGASVDAMTTSVFFTGPRRSLHTATRMWNSFHRRRPSTREMSHGAQTLAQGV